jgi:hypothetical protein
LNTLKKIFSIGIIEEIEDNLADHYLNTSAPSNLIADSAISNFGVEFSGFDFFSFLP